MQVGVGYCDNPDSRTAGQIAAEKAITKAGRHDPCSMVLLFATARHNQQVLRQEVAAVTGNNDHIYGGGSVGIITNDSFGYAGDQVGVACIWLDESDCKVIVEHDLDQGEAEAGIRLGKRLQELSTGPDSPIMLFYDAINLTDEGLRMLMATWILEGIEQGLGFFPDLVGAGIQGDHICTPTSQYTGKEIDNHTAFALAFSDDICMDSMIMHGCRPASAYYTVTKADGAVILEINGEPAIGFIDRLLGPALKPEDYPFFLLFGINQSDDPWGEYDENLYASRLCLGIDKERGGIVMFEPDMAAGTRFQLMLRSLDLDYMKPKLDALFADMEGKEPVFAMYIDCAGRCAGYGGVDIEDAFIIREAVGDRIPLLGLYTGVEIAKVAGVPRGLDWTGVFVVISKRIDKKAGSHKAVDSVPVRKTLIESDQEITTPIGAMTRLCEQNAAKALSLDIQMIRIRHELEQKRRGFRLLAELSVSLRQNNSESIFVPVTQRINAALNMQRTVVLFPDPEGFFIPSVLQGYTAEERADIVGRQIRIDPELLNPEHPVVITGADSISHLAEMRKLLKLPYFISAPVVVRNEVAALLITGRMVEATPFLLRLGSSDAETVQAISALLASVLVYQKLEDANRLAQSDVLTGLLNRGALEDKATELLRQELRFGKSFAFMVIDFDHFKDVNDTYGHLAGDIALKSLGDTLRRNFRSTDYIARVGGDEFAVFCTLGGDADKIAGKVDSILAEWNRTPVSINLEKHFYATLSVGIAIAPRDGTSYQQLFQKADVALYKAKQSGRNRYMIYDEKTMEKL